MQRRQFLNSLTSSFKGKKEVEDLVIRPPYYNDLDSFENCLKCEDKSCVSSCDENIIFIDENNLPQLNLNTPNGCSYCEECASSCELGVLQLDFAQKIDVTIQINQEKCLAWNRTMCFSCKEPCVDNAIDFSGMFSPKININKCTSCGFCVRRCPTNAIIISKQTTLKTDI